MIRPSRVSLIDDDRAWLETLADYLAGQGFQVRTAVGGLQGLDLLEREVPGVAVVDFQMPDLDGLELLRRLRMKRRNVDVLLMSNDDDPALPLRARAAGAAGFLSKCMAPSLLLPTLVRALLTTLDEMSHRPPYLGRLDMNLPTLRIDPVPVPEMYVPFVLKASGKNEAGGTNRKQLTTEDTEGTEIID